MFRGLSKKMCSMTCKKLVILVGVGMTVTLFFSYFLLFNHGPPEDVMSANQKKQGRHFSSDREDSMDDLERHVHLEEKKAFEYWEDFIVKHDFTSIGEVYDNCEEDDRIIVGKTIMLPEKKWGLLNGVKSRTFINATLESELTSGRFYLDVKYNGKAIYSKDWELCTLDADEEDRFIYCPFNPGDYSFVKDRSIPIYLPKGRYQTTGRITDQNNDVILCGISDFTL